MPGASIAIRWVAHPLTIAATVLLWLNDHAFKEAWPGLVTGKLSDAAGMAMFPALLGLLIGVAVPRVPPVAVAWTSIVATGTGFTWMKLTDAGAGAASAAWSVLNGPSTVVKDPTDLVALPALALAWWAWRLARRTPEPGDRAVFRVRLFIALPLGVLAVAGTTPADEPDAILDVYEENGRVVIVSQDFDASSVTGLAAWTRIDEPRRGEYRSYDPVRDDRIRRQGRAEMCAAAEYGHCYRLTREGVLGVDESTDGGATWRQAWGVSPERTEILAEQYGELWGGRSVLVREWPGGHQVFVADGTDGLLFRDVDGTWSRIGVRVPVTNGESGAWLDIRPLPLSQFGLGIAGEAGSGLAFGMLAMLLAAGVIALRIRPVRGPRGFAMVGVVVALSAGLAFVGGGLVAMMPHGGTVLFLDVAATGVLLAGSLTQPDIPRPRALAVVGGGLLVGLTYSAPFFMWSTDAVEAYAAARTAAAIGVVPAFALALGLAWWAGARPNPVRPGRALAYLHPPRWTVPPAPPAPPAPPKRGR